MTTPRLILDTVPDDFDPERDIALGPWCFIGREEVCSGWDRLPFGEVLDDDEVLWRDWMRTRILANRLCRTLGDDLNARHGTGYGHRYWREMTMLWLLLLIQSAWLRYRQAEQAIAEHGDTPLTVAVADELTGWQFRDDLDFFHNGPKNPDFVLWIFTLLLQDRAPEAWTLVPSRAVGYRPAAPAATPPPPLSARLAASVMKRRAVYNLTGTRRSEWLLSMLVPFMPRRPQRFPLLADEDPAAADVPPFPDDFVRLVDTLIPATMPDTLGRDFAQHDADAAALPYRPGRLFVSGASKYVPKTRFMTAHALENGERVMRYQHGAYYGSAHIMIGHEIEYYDHGFISWGWTDDGRALRAAVPLPVPMFSSVADRHAAVNADIIFVGTNMELGPYPFKPTPQMCGTLEYRRWKVRLIGALSDASRARLKYRPYVNTDSDICDLDYVAAAVGPLPAVTGNLDTHLLRCALAVIDHPGSPMFKSMVANVPTVLFWNPAEWPMHERGRQQLALLEEAGIFHPDPERAAKKIDALGDGVGEWWSSAPVQNARRAWCRGNAVAQRHWFGTWVRSLAEIA